MAFSLINPNIFRSYDIRGVYPQELNEKVAFLIGQAFVKFLEKKNPKIVVSQDNRLSSPALFRGLTKGLLVGGAKIIDIGLATTPMLYFAVANYKYDGGINITASHLPPEYNGFKLVKEKARPIGTQTGLKEIKKMAEKGKFFKKKKGKMLKRNVVSDYLNFNFKDFKINLFEHLKLVIDTGNAVPGILIPHLKKKLPLQIFPLFEKLDGKFPYRSPNPLIKGNLRFLQRQVKEKKANFGVAFDGDGDRVCFIDEKGKIISGDLIIALLVDLLLKEKSGEKIVYDIRSSNIVPETIKKAGGIPLVSRIGRPFIEGKMRKENALFASEVPGHYHHRDHYFCMAPLFVLFKIMEVISSQKRKLSDLIKPYRKYFQSGEINFGVKDKGRVLKFLEKKFSKKGKISKIDGLRVDFSDWWFLVRPSGTEDLLRLNIEARTKELMTQKKKELSSLIKE